MPRRARKSSVISRKSQESLWTQADTNVRKSLPQGVQLMRTLRGHSSFIGRIAWSPDGRMIASPSGDNTIRLWDSESWDCLRTLKGHSGGVHCVSFNFNGSILASASPDKTVRLWNTADSQSIGPARIHTGWIHAVAFHPTGDIVASGGDNTSVVLTSTKSREPLRILELVGERLWGLSFDSTGKFLASASSLSTLGEGKASLTLWDVESGLQLQKREGKQDGFSSVAFSPSAQILASSHGKTVEIRETASLRLRLGCEGHTEQVKCVAFSSDGQLLASKAGDNTVRIWNPQTGSCLAVIEELTSEPVLVSGMAFHPHLPLLATVGSDPGTPGDESSDPERAMNRDRLIHIWQLDIAVLLGQPVATPVSYTSAKVVLVGDSGVGKTGLGWRLAHGEFKEHASSHGQQFWLLDQLSLRRTDGAQCEAVLWDLAGQPDYRLIHALFLDDADLALVLFDPTRDDDPLKGVEFWLKQLRGGRETQDGIPTIMIAARSDRGTARLTEEELQTFCRQRGVDVYLSTSAKDGEGVDDLIHQMQSLLPWDDKPATVTTETFKRIKDHILDLKENRRRRRMILTSEELHDLLHKANKKWRFDDAEMLTAVGHLANHGYVARLKNSQGEPRILLAPELLNNLAASLVLEARRNQKGLGSLEEQRLLSGGYNFPELEKLSEKERSTLLDSAAVLFLEHNVCFRETDPLNGRAYLVFPELINLKRSVVNDDDVTEDGVSYTVSGAVENVYASLVVLMGYTQTFTRTNQWRNHARYEVGQGQVCGFRQEDERAGELDFVLYFGKDTPSSVRALFQSLFENFLARRNLTVHRFEPVVCCNRHTLNRAVVREQVSVGAEFAFCNRCGDQIALAKADQPIQLTEQQAAEVESNRRAADQRSRFEQVLFRLKSFVTEQQIVPPDCFISYAWGQTREEKEHERWVENNLATDLQKAGVKVLLDKWENSRIGSSIMRFVERIEECSHLIVVGTPLYRQKAKNLASEKGSVVAAEWDLAGIRMLATEVQKQTVLPVLLAGRESEAFPALLRGRVFADFRKQQAYFNTALDLLLSLYRIQPTEPFALDLKDSLIGRTER